MFLEQFVEKSKINILFLSEKTAKYDRLILMTKEKESFFIKSLAKSALITIFITRRSSDLVSKNQHFRKPRQKRTVPIVHVLKSRGKITFTLTCAYTEVGKRLSCNLVIFVNYLQVALAAILAIQ